MKLAVTSSGPALDDRMEARFGRCPYFILIDPDTLAFEALENPNIALGGGAGIQSAQLMAEKGVTVVLTGNCGPNAFQVFGAAGIQVITDVDGTVREAVEKFKSGGLTSAAGPTVAAHHGAGDGEKTGAGSAMPPNAGMPPNSGMPNGTGGADGGQMGGGMGMDTGMGRGMGRGGGKGCGMGRGMGRGGGMGRGMGRMGAGGGLTTPVSKAGSFSNRTSGSGGEEMELLKRSAEDLRSKLEGIERRIEEKTKTP